MDNVYVCHGVHTHTHTDTPPSHTHIFTPSLGRFCLPHIERENMKSKPPQFLGDIPDRSRDRLPYKSCGILTHEFCVKMSLSLSLKMSLSLSLKKSCGILTHFVKIPHDF